MNYNSVTNQTIKDKFVSQHVFANVNQMVDYILQNGKEDQNAPFNYEDIENSYNYPEYYGEIDELYFKGGTEDDKQAYIETLNNKLNELNDHNENCENDDIIGNYENMLSEIENLESEPVERYEWYLVSGDLLEQLKEKGECVITQENIWGRCSTGKAILFDGVINDICSDMEILEGQKHEW